MKKIILTVVATAAVAAAMPAAVQAQDYRGGGDRYEQRQDRTERRQDRRVDRVALRRIDARQAEVLQRIDAGLRQGRISRVEARDLRIKVQETERLERRYVATGRDLTRLEADVLMRRLNGVDDLVRQKMRGGRRY